MPVQRSFEGFHKSIAKELSVAQDRIRNLTGNIVVDYLTWERSFKSQYAWFPVEGGKETRRQSYIGLNGEHSQSF
jgi:hypothetical protein